MPLQLGNTCSFATSRVEVTYFFLRGQPRFMLFKFFDMMSFLLFFVYICLSFKLSEDRSHGDLAKEFAYFVIICTLINRTDYCLI